jgi:hypothetical protein
MTLFVHGFRDVIVHCLAGELGVLHLLGVLHVARWRARLMWTLGVARLAGRVTV